VRGPLAALGERLGRRRHRTVAPQGGRDRLPADMARGAGDMQQRLEEARSRLKRDIASPPPDDDA
jgi:hypothetical protein